jgi:glycine cleavage system H protein
MPHDLLTLFSAKAIEYPLALLYLALFIPFWRYVNPPEKIAAMPAHAPAPARVPARQPKPAWTELVSDLFQVPDQLLFHPGHAWARVEGDVVTVGLDDFGQRLVGAINAVDLPAVGSVLTQGDRAWTLVASDAKTVDMVSPVDGTVLEVNDRTACDPRQVTHDPYGAGWLLRVRGSRLAANARQLLSGGLAKRWIEESCNTLCTVSPELGPVSLDGGAPVSGMLRAIDPDNWDQLAKTFFLS